MSFAVAPTGVQAASPVIQSPEQLPLLNTPLEVFSTQPAIGAPTVASGQPTPIFRSARDPALSLLLAAAIENSRADAAPQSAAETRFDHDATSFPLIGAHQIVQCEECHLNGVFDGTPTQCGLCHNGSRSVGMPPNHVPTTQQCADCHQTSNFAVVRFFDHTQALGTCASCHNGARAPGKSPTHVQTSNLCEDCHIDLDWSIVHFDHAGVTGSCASCHNGTTATGKSVNHIASSNVCEDCHVQVDWSIVHFDHASVTGSCASCHNGTTATGKSANHLQTSNVCEDCHITTNWTMVNFDHTGVTGTCSSCHNGTTAVGKPANHVVTTAQCDACHSTLAWIPATFDHALATGPCSACHNGTIATGKPAGHFVTTLECGDCHLTSTWTTVQYTHTSGNFPGRHNPSVTCTSCHTANSQQATWRFPAYQPDCAGCHADDFLSGPHKKHENPDVTYTVIELRDCSGACHIYTDPTMTQIKELRPSNHRSSDIGWN